MSKVVTIRTGDITHRFVIAMISGIYTDDHNNEINITLQGSEHWIKASNEAERDKIVETIHAAIENQP